MRQLMMGQSSDELKRKTGWLARTATRIGAITGITDNLEFVRKATHQWMPLGQRVVIIGGELVGLELAEFLGERGRQVTVLDEQQSLGRGLTVVRRMRLIAELREHGIDLRGGAADIRIGADAVTFTDESGQAQSVPCDQVIVAQGATGDLSLAQQLEAQGFTVHAIGDALGVNYIEGAMRGAGDLVDQIG